MNHLVSVHMALARYVSRREKILYTNFHAQCELLRDALYAAVMHWYSDLPNSYGSGHCFRLIPYEIKSK